MQHGLGERGPKSAVTGETIGGPETLSEAELVANRSDPGEEVARASRSTMSTINVRTRDLSKITTPLAVVGQLGRAWACTRAAISKVSWRRFAAEMAGDARRLAFLAVLSQ